MHNAVGESPVGVHQRVDASFFFGTRQGFIHHTSEPGPHGSGMSMHSLAGEQVS